MGNINNRKYLKPREVEEVYRIRVGTLANWRCEGKGPQWVKLGRKVLYPVSCLEDWCRACLVRTVDQPQRFDD